MQQNAPEILAKQGWTVIDRLSEIKVPTLVLAGRDDFQFPPEHQAALAGGIANARLEIIERAGHNAPTERSAEVIEAVKDFMSAATPGGASQLDGNHKNCLQEHLL